MSEFKITDCLVLKFEEIDISNNEIDNTVYVLYDTSKLKYIIRGKRKNTLKFKSDSYSFECNSKKDLVSFLQYIICKFNFVNETLYNYNNFPKDSNEISFELLKIHDTRNNEVAGYDNVKLTKRRLIRNLNIIEEVNNIY